MQHRGEIVRQVVEVELNISQTELAEKLGKHRNTIARWYGEPTLADHIIRQIGKAIHFDFSSVIKDLESYDMVNLVNESPVDYNSVTDLKEKLDQLMWKYSQLLEKYAALLEKGNK